MPTTPPAPTASADIAADIAPPVSRRRFLGTSVAGLGSAGIAGCGGGGGEAEARAIGGTPVEPPAPSPSPPSPPPAPPPPPPPPPVGTVVTTLQLNLVSAGTYPYSATVAPLRGAIPTGYDIESPDDGSLRSSVLSRHDDGSIALAVVSGTTAVGAGGSARVRLQAGAVSTAAALTPAAIGALVRTVSVAFGGTLGTATISDFNTPERVWWANARTICARYRTAPASPGTTALEAVIDIQAWSDRALVEVVIENAKMSSASPTKPTVATYTGAEVSVNGRAVGSGNADGVPSETGHNAFRAWYARGWVGAGDPQVVAHQVVADLQEHPLLFRVDCGSTIDLSGYDADRYTQWGFGRKTDAYMGRGGDVPGIGPLPLWDAHWLQSGDPRVARAIDVQALLTLHWNVNHRERSTGRVPTHAEVDLKSINGNRTWPHQTNSSDALTWELMHHPAVGLAAFLARPSPVFIELAQKIAIWNAMWPTNFDNNAVQPTGVFRGGGCTTRGRAWGLRSLAHAIFLTPDNLSAGTPDPWKPAAKRSLSANVAYLDRYRTDSKSKLNICWEGDPEAPQNVPYGAAARGGATFSTRGWFSHFLIPEVHKIAAARLLAGSEQTAVSTLADWLAGFPVRWVNEQTDGSWRFIPYSTVIGRNSTQLDMPDTWAAMSDYVHFDRPASVAGPWFFSTEDPARFATDYGSRDPNRPRYVDYFWAALVAAVERNIPGAIAAWSTVNANVTNTGTWRSGFGTEPRWGPAPRNSPPVNGYGALGSVATALAPGNWVEWSATSNVRQIADVNPHNGVRTGWLESKPNLFLTNWPGSITWDSVRKRLLIVGASQGTSSDTPPGWSTSLVSLDVTTGMFGKQWNPVKRNTFHVYDSNSTRPLGNYIYRTAPSPATLFKMDLTTNTWSQADDLAAMRLGFGDVPALEVHPTLGAQGSILVTGTGGRLGRVDRATGAVTLLAESLAGVVGLSPVISYHPGIDAVVVGGGEAGRALHKVSNTGAISLLTDVLPPGVPSLSPDSSTGNTVLAPDPAGRAVAWVFDEGTTRRVWRLDLRTGAWSNAGALPTDFASVAGACVGTIPELGVHVWFDGNGRESPTASNARVWVFKPA